MKPRFQALFLDFYGTIAGGDRQAVHRSCENVLRHIPLPYTLHELEIIWGEAFFSVIGQSNHESFQTLMDCERISLRRVLGPQWNDFDIEPLLQPIDEYLRNPPLYSDAIELLHHAHMEHIPICIVSNADTEHLHSALAHLVERVDHVITSEDVRSYKPDCVIFARALQDMSLQPEQVLHVGDSLHSDIGGARGAGLNTTWLCRANRIHDLGGHEPDYKINDLTELLPILFHE